MRLDKALIGIGVFVLFVAIGVGSMFGTGGLFTNYGTDASDSNFNKITQNLTEVYDIGIESKDAFTEQDIEEATGWENLITGGYKVLRQFTSSFAVAGNIIMALGEVLNIPAPILGFFMTAMLIFIIFAMVYMVFRFMPRGD